MKWLFVIPFFFMFYSLYQYEKKKISESRFLLEIFGSLDVGLFISESIDLGQAVIILLLTLIISHVVPLQVCTQEANKE